VPARLGSWTTLPANITARFGALADFDELLVQAHARGLKVLLDFVPNHTSDRHLWFVESRTSRHNPKRDWYIWRDPAPDGGPPAVAGLGSDCRALLSTVADAATARGRALLLRGNEGVILTSD